MSAATLPKRSASALDDVDDAPKQRCISPHTRDNSGIKRRCSYYSKYAPNTIFHDLVKPSNTHSKRRHDSASPNSNFVSLPLTAENLQKLEAQAIMPRTGSRSPVKSSTKSSQGGFKLRCFSVFCGGRNEPLPHSLQLFADNVLLKPQPETPSAVRIAQRANAAAKMSEPNGKALLRRFLLPKTRMQSDDDDDEAIEQIDVSAESNLAPDFLPEPADAAAKQWFNILEAPRPDDTVGYLRRHLADSRAPRLQSPFTLAEERIFAPFDACKEVTFPFLTFQWKSALNGGTMEGAERQASRDGAALVNSMHQLLKAAYPHADPEPQNTAHISITCDMRTAVAWIHWRQIDDESNITYEMERLAQSFCNDYESMRQIRAVIKNATEYALDPRLKIIKSAIEVLKEKLEADGSVAQVVSQQIVPQSHLATPSVSSTVSDSPARKRPRLDAVDKCLQYQQPVEKA